METRWIDARFEELEAKVLDLHRRLGIFEEMYKDDVEDFKQEVMEEQGVQEDTKKKGKDEDGKRKQKQRPTDE